MTDSVPSRRPTERFSGRVEAYRRYRSRFPREIISVLQQRCGLTPASIVADIGAGTGMLAELFLEHGNAVFAVEPNAEMRAACEELSLKYPALTCIDGTAEATGLADHSIDFIAVGRAFHWFDREKCRPEFLRILRSGGWVVIASSGLRRGPDGVSRDHELLLREHGIDYTSLRDRYNVDQAVREFFAGSQPQQVDFPSVENLTYEELEGHTLSLSVTPQPDHPKFPAFQQALREYFDRYESGGKLALPTRCRVVIAQLRESSATTTKAS
jgi:SAM-dependent methyltransferase